MACKYYNVTISQSDLNNAVNNSDSELDGKVFISYTDCNGNPESITYSSAGTYSNAFCADPSESIIALYWSEDLGNLTFSSFATEGGDCVAPTPRPSRTPSISISPTPSTTPLNVCNCISFTNTTNGALRAGYTSCSGVAVEILIQPNSSIVICGSNPSGGTGIVIDTLGNCVGRNCIPFSPSPTPSTSITPSFSVTPSITPSVTPSISITPSKTPSISITPTISPSKTVPPSMTPTPTISVSKTPSLTPLPSVSKTPSISVTPSITPSNFTSPSPTPSLSTTGSIPTVAGLCMNIQFGAAPSITPSISVSRTPSATPTVTPSITPSTTPSSTNPPPTLSRTPSRTPSISISTTPSVTPSRTPSVSITPSITRSISVTPSKTPTPTPSSSSGSIDPCNTILYRTQTSQYYSYNFLTNTSTLLNVAPNPNPTLDTSNGVPITLAHTTTKSWVYAWDTTTNATVIRESNITLSPFTSTFNRNIALPTGYKPANGLVAINDTTLVGVNKVQYLGVGANPIKDEYFVIEYDISGATAVDTIKFKTPQFKKPVGGFIRTTGSSPKIIMLTQPDYAPGGNLYLSQYDYNTGQLEVLQQLSQPVSPNNTGLATVNGNLYIMGFNVYKINTTFPYNTTFIKSPGTQLVNASQLPSCHNITLTPNICYGGLPPINVPNTVTYNGITISITGSGAATQMWDVSYNTCDVINNIPVDPNSILLGKKWQANPQLPTNFSYTMNFSQPVNNIKFLMAAMNGTIGQSPESFTFTSNVGNITISSTNNCFSLISGNTITANEGGVATSGGAGTFLISAATPFTQLTIAGPGGLGGTVMSVDCSTVIPVGPPPSPGVSPSNSPSPSLSPTPTPSLTPPVSPNVGVNTIYKYLDIL